MPIAERRRPPQSRPNRFAGGIEKDTERCDKPKWGRPCGRPHSHRRVGPEGRLTPGVFRVTGPEGQSRYVARRSRRCRFRRGTDEVRRPRPNHPAVPRPVFQPGSSTGSAMRGIASPSEPAGKSGLPTAHLRGLNGLEVAASEDALAFIPPPRGTSPSRRNRFQNLFFFQGVTPSIRRANPRSRCLENAPAPRVGQAGEALVIHFQAFCRWTRVDNSDLGRENSGLAAIPFRQ